MICSKCIYKCSCMYEPLEEWEEGCFYAPCVHISDKHAEYIKDKNSMLVAQSINDSIASLFDFLANIEEK